MDYVRNNWLKIISLKIFVAISTIGHAHTSIESIVEKNCCLGWREWVTLPDLFNGRIMAKVDSGAKTSALHAENIEIFEKDNQEWVRFLVFPKRDSNKIKHEIEARVIETKNIRSSNGKLSIRPVIETNVSIGSETFPIEITLVDRSAMGYRMLLGRTAMESKFLIDSGKSFVFSEKKISTSPEETEKNTPKLKKGKDFFKNLRNSTFWNIVQTVVAIIVILLLRWLVIWTLNRGKFHSPAAKRMFIVYSRNAAILLLGIALLIIWSREFKSVSIYFMAISVAIVLLLKELIQNLHGGFLLTSSQPFKIGDRIEIKKVRGDVVDTNFMTTKIAEVGVEGSGSELSGRITTVPNSIFLDAPIVNETYRRGFVPHTFVYPLKEHEDWRNKEKIFLAIIEEVSARFIDEAKEYINSADEVETLGKVSVEPKISYSFPSPGRLDMEIRLIVPTRERSEVESTIKRLFLEKIEESRKER